MSSVLEARMLMQTINGKKVIDNISFEVRNGECFGLVGEDNSAKSILFLLMTCQQKLSSGELFIFNLDGKKNSKRVKGFLGVSAKKVDLDDDFTVKMNLIVYSMFYGVPRKVAEKKSIELLRYFKMGKKENSSIMDLSYDQKRILQLCRATLHDPKMLIIEEPTLGLKDSSKEAVWSYLLKLKKQGKTIVVCSEDLHEAELLCDRVGLISGSKILAMGEPLNLIRDYIGVEVIECKINSCDIDYYLSKLRSKFDYEVLLNQIRLFLKPGQSTQSALKFLSGDNIMIRKPSLEDVFLKVINTNKLRAV